MGKKFWWIVSVVAALAAVFVGTRFARKTGDAPKYRLQAVERGDVTATVSATGTLSAVTTVKVGSQVSGIISKLHADFNSKVKKGELLVELDPTAFQQQVDQRRADLEKTKIEMRNSHLTFERSKKLLADQLVSQQEYDVADLNYRAASASVTQSEASVRQAETNLSYTRIVSPIDGVVVERQYDIGQTVAASFQAPTLFTIAQDLTKMQVLINVDEADVGRIQLNLAARFTVDAFPERKFEGKISQIRLAPQTVQNVVTYPVLLDVANPELELKPGMTANVSIPVETRTAVLKIPNSALRFIPDPNEILGGVKGEKGKPKAGAPGAASTGSPSTAAGEGKPHDHEGARGKWQRSGGEGAGEPRGEKNGGGKGGGRGGVVYLVNPSGKLRPVPVKTSITDGNYTAVDSTELKEGDSVVAGLVTAKVAEGSGGIGGGQGRRPGGPR